MRKDAQFVVEMGKRLREARLERGYTIEALAEQADVAPQYISEVERGKKALGSENLRAICVALQKSADFFLFGVGDAGPKRALMLERLVALTPLEQTQLIRVLDSAARVVQDLRDESEV